MSFASTAAAKNPKIWLRLNEASGTTAADSSGNGYSGTYVGTPGLGTTGLLASEADAAVTFSGDDYVTVPHASGWGDGGVSLFLRAKPANVAGTKQLISRRIGTATGIGGGGFTIRMDSASLVFYPFANFSGNTITFGSLTAGQTYSVGLSYNPTLGQYEAYLDGILVGTKVTSYRVSTFALGVGASGDHPSETFNGVLDEVLYTNGYWSATDQADLHAAAVSAAAPSGSMAASLPALTFAGTGSAPTPGTLAVTLPVPTMAATGSSPIPGALSVSLPVLEVAAAGVTPPARTGFGLVLDSTATVTAEPPLEAFPPGPGGAPDPVQHIITPTVPAPTLVNGRPS